MIDFACKQIQVDEVIKCSLGLTKGEYKIFEHMLKHKAGKTSAPEIARALKLDLTTVQKSVKKLSEKKVVSRTQKNLSGGGYVYCYNIKDKQEIMSTVMKTIQDWTGKVEKDMKQWVGK